MFERSTLLAHKGLKTCSPQNVEITSEAILRPNNYRIVLTAHVVKQQVILVKPMPLLKPTVSESQLQFVLSGWKILPKHL